MPLSNWPDLSNTETLVLILILATVIFLLFYPYKKIKNEQVKKATSKKKVH
jgi:cellobiose-specific phosphotransferase system component IIC